MCRIVGRFGMAASFPASLTLMEQYVANIYKSFHAPFSVLGIFFFFFDAPSETLCHTIPWVCYHRRNHTWLRLALALFGLLIPSLACLGCEALVEVMVFGMGTFFEKYASTDVIPRLIHTLKYTLIYTFCSSRVAGTSK